MPCNNVGPYGPDKLSHLFDIDMSQVDQDSTTTTYQLLYDKTACKPWILVPCVCDTP